MRGGVMFCRLFRMMSRLNLVSMRGVSVMPCRFVIAGLMMLGGFRVMPGRMSVVFGRLLVMLRALVLCHSCRLLRGHFLTLVFKRWRDDVNGVWLCG
jgi:hypothetical protein